MDSREALLAETMKLLQEIGIDPEKIAKVKLFPHMLKEHLEGRWTKKQFQDNCRKIAIFNNWPSGKMNA